MTMWKLLGTGANADSSTLRSSIRKSLTRAMLRSVGAALLASGLAATAGMLLSGIHGRAVAIVSLAMLASGGAAGLALVLILSAAISRLAARPVELLLEQPGIIQGLDDEPINWKRDCTLTRREIEQDIQSLHRLLRRASRRSAELIENLKEARETANAQNEAKSQFLAKMSHELRTPLNAILGYATLLHEDASEAGNGAAAADLERITVAGRSLLAVINDILDLTKIEAGATSVDRQAINVRELAETVIAAAKEGGQHGNRIELVVADDVGIMVGDARKIRQCLGHLMSNAAKFTNDGKITLSISQASSAAAVVFAVTDTGIGIEEQHLPSLFDAFSQAKVSRSGRHPGAGLGLAITRRLARIMGGDCTVESAPGEGSIFRLQVPLVPPAAKAAHARRSTDVKAIAPCRAANRKSVLVIDDDEATLDLMRRWLEPLDYDVAVALDGESGLSLLREIKPNLVLLDAWLPGRSGYEILKEMRSDPEIAATPVILVTVDDDRARGLSCGASDYLRKPVSEESLTAVLDVYARNCKGEVLVIEDDDDSAELIKRSVEQVGFSARRARDGMEGLAMAAENRPAAIVLDIRMPELDGFAVIERLAVADQLNDVPVIVVSGCDISLAQHRRLAAAGHRVFTKGLVTPREIAQSLREMVA
jgi:signal transduction histidine kinase/DNA-binding response OmpR family regulator